MSFCEVLHEHLSTIQRLRGITPVIEQASELIIETLRSGNKILLCGNGGSAADAQHIAAELVVRYCHERQALPAVAITTDTSIITAHANDYDFDTIFCRQIEALGRAGDCLLALSTSGKSSNICEAAKAARKIGIHVVALTGGNGGALAPLADIAVVVPSTVTARIQEAHILIAHWWCEKSDEEFGKHDD